MAGVKFSSVLFLVLILTVMGWLMQSLLLPQAAEARTDSGRSSAAVQAVDSVPAEASADATPGAAG